MFSRFFFPGFGVLENNGHFLEKSGIDVDFLKFKLKLRAATQGMATVLKSATKSAARDKRRKQESDTDSGDSAVLMAKLDERDRRMKAKVESKAKQDEEAAILKMLNDQTAKNASRLKELAAARNSYPVIL